MWLLSEVRVPTVKGKMSLTAFVFKHLWSGTLFSKLINHCIFINHHFTQKLSLLRRRIKNRQQFKSRLNLTLRPLIQSVGTDTALVKAVPSDTKACADTRHTLSEARCCSVNVVAVPDSILLLSACQDLVLRIYCLHHRLGMCSVYNTENRINVIWQASQRRVTQRNVITT